MEIERVEVIPLSVPLKQVGAYRLPTGQPARTLDLVITKITTKSGIVGYGEAFCFFAMARDAVTAVIRDMVTPLVLGRDASAISQINQDLRRKLSLFGSGIAIFAISSVDIALWDIAGKAAGVPVHKLLGGASSEFLKCGASISHCNDERILGERIRSALPQKYHAIKIHERLIEHAQAAREIVGDDLPLVLDVNSAWSYAEASDLIPKLVELNLLFLEDPIWPSENFDALAALQERFGVPLAAGGTYSSVREFFEAMRAGSLRYCQPSVTVVGGISELRKVKTVADLHNVVVAPHTPYFGPGYLASIHVAASFDSSVVFFRNLMRPEVELYVDEVLLANGQIQVPTAPGLGADPNPDVITRYRTG